MSLKTKLRLMAAGILTVVCCSWGYTPVEYRSEPQWVVTMTAIMASIVISVVAAFKEN